jgi:hypothetical protein
LLRIAGWLVLALIPVACGGPVTESEPIRTATPLASPARVSVPPTMPAQRAFSSAAPSASPSQAAAKLLTIRWKTDDPTGLGKVTSIVGVARAGDAYVLVAQLPYLEDGRPEVAAWWSMDGKAWQLAQEFPPGEHIMALTAGGPGFVVGGFAGDHAAVWTSVDGRIWKSVSDASLAHGVVTQLVPTASGIVGFGYRSDREAAAIWTSSDGFEWLAATNETGLKVASGLQAVAAYDGRAIALVREGDEPRLEIWETSGRAEWTQVGSLSTKAQVDRLAGGARGWVAVGSNLAWTSTDGRHWNKGVPGPDVASDLIVDDAGFVAVGWVGSLPDETCGDQRPFAGHTWTSSDGRIWDRMPVGAEFKAAMVTRLLVVDRTLLGFGERVSGFDGSMPVGRWAATLPDITRSADVSDKASDFKGCGG